MAQNEDRAEANEFPEVTMIHGGDKNKKLVVTSTMQMEGARKMGFEAVDENETGAALQGKPAEGTTKSEAQLEQDSKELQRAAKKGNK